VAGVGGEWIAGGNAPHDKAILYFTVAAFGSARFRRIAN